MPRNLQVVRELRLVRRLERARVGATLCELAGEFAVSERTIRRDLDALQAAGVPVIDKRDAGGERRWRVLDWRKEAA